MSRILLVWELGGNLGHVTRLYLLAKTLRGRGHHVTLVIRDPRGAADALTTEHLRFVQAPVVRSATAGLPREPASYPEILLHCGFADSSLLSEAVRRWRELYRNLAPDVTVFDHAPTALLAARDTGIPCLVFGTGFASPPRISPMPSIRPWQQIPAERLLASEQRALNSANAALRSVGAEPMNHLYELFDVEENILATLPELDHYGARPNTHYWGPVFQNAGGHRPRWPEAEGIKRSFVYIRPDSAAFTPLVTALRRLNLSTLWFAPGLRDDALAQLRSPTLEFIRDPVDMPAVCASTHAAVLHGGHGTTAAMLLAGVPVLLLPEHVEQFLLGRNVAALGAGAALNIGSPGLQIAEMLQRITNDPRYTLHAKDFAARNSHLHRTDQDHELVALIGTVARDTKPRETHLNPATAKA